MPTMATPDTHERELIIGLSGASGMPYALAFIRAAFDAGLRLRVIATNPARSVLAEEAPGALADDGSLDLGAEIAASDRVVIHNPTDMTAPPASGTFRSLGMAIVPCSMRTLGALASGVADNLLLRAADCQLKEARKLIIVPRETPLNLIHLENMARLARAGAVILPAMPAYYYHPQSLSDHERFLTSKLCDQFDIECPAPVRWNGGEKQ